MWNWILDRMMRDFVKVGTFVLTYPDGTRRTYGDGQAPKIEMTFHDKALPRRVVLSPDMALGEGYMDGTITFAEDDLDGFLSLATMNIARADEAWWRVLSARLHKVRRLFDQWNPAHRARANVAHHYDLSSTLYDLFLDEDRQYSCAYFADPSMSLDAAQRAKKHHIAGKLLLRPGMRVLEIGCGWGGMALTLARDYGVEVLGVTLSEEQHRIATERAKAAGLQNRVTFRLQDYRDVTGQFDRIVSIGMFEHVGAPHFREYFRHVHDLLTEDGVALIHSIGRAHPPGHTSPWIQKYIFPGGYCPSLSEMAAAVEHEDLYPTDIEVWRLHYAETLRHWSARFAAREQEARALFDERFCRMWRYYLKAAEVTFRYNRQCVFQFQMARRQEAVPLTRDYLYPADASARHHAAE
ncbi:cyclopropane-fatty-acyl-phospholipid synthase family protein [Rhodobacteraceae bacterium N5(2021)]|uniref:Cyclopropane-fatty-acyl-phospholipid synthase family protein n=1 Tax=Gymnodinialimonas phycosphaerae TaxID=2841589 RepID=A0A975TUW4_9RHOB|nr:cyclopropane-fatty-acyl-phospholipid synthase family protein [Gymnodinialimonas phycosphaerae]MBY4895111.1 cyclopropane-fatty-acyl-phospholipid synthase family protein [Gymnodinialimonas phycosphaerae]